MLEGLPHWMPASVAMLYPFADALLLLAGRPATLSIWDIDDSNAPVFTTGDDYQPLGRGLVVDIPNSQGASPAFACQLDFAARPISDSPGDWISEEEVRATIQSALRGDPETNASKSFFQSLHGAINETQKSPASLSASPRVARSTTDVKEPGRDRLEGLIPAVTQLVDQASAPFAESLVHTVDLKGRSIFNLFAVAYACSFGSQEYSFKAGLLPTRGCQSMRSHFDPDHSTSFFQYINSLDPRDIVTYAQGDGLKSIASALLNTHDQDKVDDLLNSLGIRSAFVAPVHIDGFPWIALIRLLRDDPQDWNDAFKFYREVVPRISTHLRSDLEEFYVDTVADAVRSEVDDVLSELRIESINERCRSLSAVFPFERIVFSPGRQNEHSQRIDTFPSESIWISSTANPYFQKSLEYDSLDIDKVARRCHVVLQNIEQQKLEEANRVHEQFKKHVEQQAHTFFNRDPGDFLFYVLERCGNEISAPDVVHRYLKDAQKAAFTQNTALRLALKPQEPPRWLAKRNSVTKLLRWLQDHSLSDESQTLLQIDEAHDVHLAQAFIAPAFTVLWNLWHNAVNHYKTERLRVTAHKNGEGATIITFSNEGEMPGEWVQYLQGGEYPKEDRTSGLRIVRYTLPKLNWGIERVAIREGKTQISINVDPSIS